MSLYKQPGSACWFVNITTPEGRRLRRTTGTEDKKTAQEYHDKLKHEMWRINKMGDSPSYTWDEAVTRYMKEKIDKRSIEHDRTMLNWASPFLKGMALAEITKDVVEDLMKKRREGKVLRTEAGTSNATINRYMEAIQRVLNCAVTWGWITEHAPIRHLTEPKGRLRFLTEDEATLLLSNLPEHMREIAEFTLCTGLRENNALELEWNQVSIKRKVAWVHADQFKQNVAYACPLSDRAIEILEARKGVDAKYVFSYEGVPLTKASNHSWYRAVEKSGLKGRITWHGLRHTWASWHVMSGTPLGVLKELGGWEDLTSVMRYAHLSAGHVAQYANNAKPQS